MNNLILGAGSRVKHKEYGRGVVVQAWSDSYEICFIDDGVKEVPVDEELELIEFVADDNDRLSFTRVEDELIKILRRFSDIQENVELGSKWNGGMLILKPGNPDLQNKEIPIETFFHKIVMVRDRLRVMEQRINASKLSDEEKVNLQQYITRIYGSLTTFNVLFTHKEDQFSGEKS
jgi:hypothetical protein